MKKIELSVVILSYNTRTLLKDCLESLKTSDVFDKLETTVVDNGSTDGSMGMVKKEYSWVKIIQNGKNLGFAAGNNTALKRIRSEFVLLLNPDTVVFPDTISRVLEYLKLNKKVGAATCRVELPDGRLDYSCHRGFPTPWNSFCYFSGLSGIFPKSELFSGYTATFQNIDTLHEIDALTGAFALIRVEAGKQVGWLDEDYFWNGEDLDLCYKLKEKGWIIVFVPDVKIIHFKGSASGLRKTGFGKADRVVKRNAALSSTQVMKIFYKKHLAKKEPFFINWLVYLGINLLEAFRIVKHSI